MKARILLYALPVLILVTIHLAGAQQPKRVPRIGFVIGTSPTIIPDRIEGFRQGLRELGYVEGKDIVIEYRVAEGKVERLPDLLAELVHLKVDVIVTGGIVNYAAKQATTTMEEVKEIAGREMASPVDMTGGILVFSRRDAFYHGPVVVTMLWTHKRRYHEDKKLMGIVFIVCFPRGMRQTPGWRRTTTWTASFA